MPSVSPKQAKLMRAVAHGWHKPGGGPSMEVAREFVKADEAKSKGKRNRAQKADRHRSTSEWAEGKRKTP